MGLLATLALATAAFTPAVRAADAEKAALDNAVERVFPALVRITVVMEEPGDGRLEKQTGAGSGAIISEDGYIITNHHVAGKARHLLCRMADGEEIEAKLIGTDALADIAVIQLDLSRRKNKGKLPVARSATPTAPASATPCWRWVRRWPFRNPSPRASSATCNS